MKSVLFITWDGAQTNYLESLFFPIFREIARQEDYEFHVLQFTWADQSTIERITISAADHNCRYTPVAVGSDKYYVFGKAYAILAGSQRIAKYVSEHNIDLIMPRSTIPAMMMTLASRRFRGIKTVFDADGLPNMERVDFAGQKKTGLLYWLREKTEIRMMKNANAILVRSSRAIEIHLQVIGERFKPKFFIVANGRDPQLFRPDANVRREVRQRLGLTPHTTLFVYCGSIGPQYLPDEMLAVFSGYKKFNPDTKFLIITGDGSVMEQLIPDDLRSAIIMMQAPFSQIPEWLNAGDIAFSLRQPKYSMQGVSPIKLGEYMMMGLPTVASTGIGDTEQILRRLSDVFLYDYTDPDRIRKTVEWCVGLSANRMSIRSFGVEYFSLDQSVENYSDAFRYVFSLPTGSRR